MPLSLSSVVKKKKKNSSKKSDHLLYCQEIENTVDAICKVIYLSPKVWHDLLQITLQIANELFNNLRIKKREANFVRTVQFQKQKPDKKRGVIKPVRSVLLLLSAGTRVKIVLDAYMSVLNAP